MFNPVALELQRLVENPDINAAQLSAAVARDPSLVAQVLRLANASRYAGLSKISTIEQALLRLGTHQVCRLAIAAAQFSLYKSKNRVLGIHMTNAWNHAYACAVGARWIAEKSGYADLAEAAFLGGLLHDIGNLLILMVMEDIEASTKSAMNFSDALLGDILGGLHCESGYMLMQCWNLPDLYCNIARDHHLAGDHSRNELLMFIRLMDQVCQRMGIGCDAAPGILPAASDEANALGLREIALAELEVVLEESMELQAA